MNYPDLGLGDPEKELNRALDRVLINGGVIKAGHRVGIGVGSRGITGIAAYVAILCQRIRELGAHPVIVPAMGSHGGASARGQTGVLETLGITEAACNAPILSNMDAEVIGTVLGDVPVYFSKDALAMDHSVCINRIKPHTKFKGPLESGIYKMLCVGMGKHKGAIAYHDMALKYGFFDLLKAMGDEILQKSNFRFAVAVVEDAHDSTMAIEALEAGELFKGEARLLETAKERFPGIPFSTLDLLVIHQIGKEISGSGMDPNVTGRTYDYREDDFSDGLDAKRIVLLNLSEKTGGNAIGLGNADIITEKLFQAMDYGKTVMNALTSISLRKAFIPVRLPNDEKAIQAGFTTLGPVDPNDIRAVIIKDTRHTSEFFVSSALLSSAEDLEQAEIFEELSLEFDGAGTIRLF